MPKPIKAVRGWAVIDENNKAFVAYFNWNKKGMEQAWPEYKVVPCTIHLTPKQGKKKIK